jgi:uncharacterized protein (TIGR01244 family)
MLVFDHGAIRVAYQNCHQICPGFWRSAQPSPRDLRRAAQLGIRTVVNLRRPSADGPGSSSLRLEVAACEEAGLELIHFPISSHLAPSRSQLLEASILFSRLRYPLLVHCKTGADRAGFMSALYLLMQKKRPLDEALQQLRLRYGHLKFTRVGLIDAFFEQYRCDGEIRGLGFTEWVETAYDPNALLRSVARWRQYA